MAIEVKRISVNAIERAIKESEENNYVQVDWRGETIVVKRKLGLAEMMAFVESVAESCFDDNGVFMPEIGCFSKRCAILGIYGNFRLPANVEQRYDFVYSDVMKDAESIILSHVDQEQYEEILDAIQDRVDLRANSNIEKANREVQELVRSLSDMEGMFNGVFGDMSQDEVKNLISVLARGVDEEKIVNAYMDRMGQEKDDAVPGRVIEFQNVDENDAGEDGDVANMDSPESGDVK